MKKFLTLCIAVCFASAAFPQFSENSIFENKSQIFGGQNISERPVKSVALMNKYDVKFYWLNISLERTSTYISGNVTINAVVQGSALDTFAVELVSQLTVDSAKINGTICTVSRSGSFAYIKLGTVLNPGSDVSAQIFYHGTPPTGGFFSGISHATSPSWGNEVVWTLSEPYNGNQWWPCKQELTDKADSSWVFVTTDNANKVGSNGILENVVTVAGNKLRYEWKSRNPIDCYLISVAVAKYVDYTIYCHPVGMGTDSLMIQNYVYDNPSTLPYFQDIIDSTAQMIELYAQLYGPYPFGNEKYGHSMAPLGGGMEHQTMTTLGSFSFMLIDHELGHMWWGDNVTCGTWSDIWINEGFASYSEYLCNQYLHSKANADVGMLDVHTSVMSDPGGSIYVPTADLGDMNRIFDSRLSYDKGSAIIHMIRFEMQNDTNFFNTLKQFQIQYNKSTAIGDDFKAVAETQSGVDFTDFFNQWYYGEGYPTYDIVWNQVNDTVYFSATQTTSSAITPLFKMLMEYKLNSPSGDTLIRVYQTANVNYYKIPTHKTITGIVVDPDNWVVNEVGSVVVGTSELESPVQFSVAPNPCSENFSVYLSNPNNNYRTIIISDITGRAIRSFGDNSSQPVIDIRDLNSGVYLLKITDGNYSVTKKFVKE
jgi:aminopeptidase N